MVSRVFDDVGASLGRGLQPTFGYYRQPNGWVTISPISELEKQKYVAEGWTHLAKYGAFDMTTYTANHPFEGLFMFGGASEMCLDQVIGTGLYIDPPLVPTCGRHLTQFHRGHTPGCWQGARPVEFPQLAKAPAGMVGPFPCEFCERKLPTRQAREQHQQVAHNQELGNLRTGRSLGDSLAEALGKVQTVSAANGPSYEELVNRLAKLEKAQTKPTRRRRQKKVETPEAGG